MTRRTSQQIIDDIKAEYEGMVEAGYDSTVRAQSLNKRYNPEKIQQAIIQFYAERKANAKS